MDQETAKHLFEEGAIFLFLGVPEGTEFGIDFKSWTTGEKFRGVKMIPAGLHFIFYNSADETDIAPRMGFFHNFRKGEILAKKWDKIREMMSDEEVLQSEIVSFKDNLLVLDSFLGPYPFDILDKWNSLTQNITEELALSLSPVNGQVRSVLELQSISDADRPRGPTEGDEEPGCSTSKRIKLLPVLKPVEGTALRLTAFPEKNYPEGSTPAEITKHSLDSTYVLELMLKKYTNYTDIIGEFEFCFICFLVGHSLEAFEQWKKFITLFCSISKIHEKYQRLYILLVDLLRIHVKEIPEEFLADIVSNNNVVYTNLKNLFRNIQNSDLSGHLKSKAERFMKDLKDCFSWDFSHLDSDDEDEAPVVVAFARNESLCTQNIMT